MPETTVAPVGEVREKLAAWLSEREGFPRGVKFYTQAEWKAKGETVGADASLTLIVEESLLGQILNYYADTETIGRTEADLTGLLEPLGYWWELGFAWSLHVYPL